MKVLKILVMVLFALGACRAKYNTKNAVEILPSSNIQEVDYTLAEDKIISESASQVVNLTEGKIEKMAEFGFVPKSVFYDNGIVYALNKRYFGMVELNENNAVNVSEMVLHNLDSSYSADFAFAQSFALVYNAKSFVVFDTTTLEKLWQGKIDASAMASKFVCSEERKACFAATVEGDVVEVNLAQRDVQKFEAVQKQETVLTNLYMPAIFQNYFIFVANNTDFALFNVDAKKMVAGVPFVEADSASIFDINLVNFIEVAGKNLVISYTNGMNVFSLLYGKPVWNKSILTGGAVVFFGDYMIFYEKEGKKITAMNVEKGGVKWASSLQNPPIAMFINYERQLVLLEKDGINFLNVDTGEAAAKDGQQDEQKNGSLPKIKMNGNGVVYAFAKDDAVHYVKGNKVFVVK